MTYRRVWIVMILYLLLLPGCKTSKSSEEKNEEVKVSLVEVTKRTLQEDLQCFGNISYNKKNNITVQVGGILKNLFVREGDYVSKNQTLAHLDNVQLQIQQEQAQNLVETARAELALKKTKLSEGKLLAEKEFIELEKIQSMITQKKRELEESVIRLDNSKELFKIGGITETEVRNMEINVEGKKSELYILEKELEGKSLGYREEDLIKEGIIPASDPFILKSQLIELNTKTLKTEVQVAETNLKNAEKSLQSVSNLIHELTIQSPCSGIIGVEYFEEGEYVHDKEKLITVMDVDRVLGVFAIQEKEMPFFKVGSPLEIDIPSLGYTVTTSIKEIAPIADAQSGNFSVKAEIDNKENKIKPGMFISCRVIRETEELPCIPETAVFYIDTAPYVFKAVNNYLVLEPLKIKQSQDGQIWIDQVLATGELVVNNPSPFLKEGTYVGESK